MKRDDAVQLGCEWIARGVPVVPMVVEWDPEKEALNKRPSAENGHRSATLDCDGWNILVTAAWQKLRDGQDLVVAGVPGSGGYLVLDDDQGGTAFTDLKLPATFRVESASKGYHYWYRKPENIEIGNKTPWGGIDIRADNGCIVLAGSTARLNASGIQRDFKWTGETEFSDIVELPADRWAELAIPAGRIPVAQHDGGRKRRNADPGVGAHRWTRIETLEDRDRLDPLDRQMLMALEEAGGHTPVLNRDGTIAIVRPGKDSGPSASIGYTGPGTATVWTSGWTRTDTGEVFPEGARLALQTGRIVEDRAVRVGVGGEGRGTTPMGPRLVDGGSFVFDEIEHPRALWGDEAQVLWPHGESLLLVGGTGVGKSTLAVQVVGCLLGVDHELLGYPVRQIDGRVLYLAMDRPMQLRRLMQRRFGADPAQRDRFKESLVVHEGPLARPITTRPEALVEVCLEASAQVVVVDSLKDIAPKLSDDEAGGSINLAVQLALQEKVEVMVLHHERKDGAHGGGIGDVYGSTLITAGAGSVLRLKGKPGDAQVRLEHLKVPAERVGPHELVHDHLAGATRVANRTHGDEDLFGYVIAAGRDGRTVKECAGRLGGDPDRSAIDRVRGQLKRLVDRGLLECTTAARGGSGGSAPDRYVAGIAAAEGCHPPGERRSTARRSLRSRA